MELIRRLRELEVDAPLAARVLASRATATDAPVLALLHAPDPLVQREAVAGYARSTRRIATGTSPTSARYGADVEVRRAALAGLARLDDASAAIVDLLAVSARLDPDPLCRAIAGGIRMGDDTREVAWLHSDHRPDGAPYEALLTTSASVRALAFDADGDALVLGVSAGPTQLRLAPRRPLVQPCLARAMTNPDPAAPTVASRPLPSRPSRRRCSGCRRSSRPSSVASSPSRTSLRLFEEGVRLSRSLKRASTAPRRVIERLLSVDAEGRAKTAPFETTSDDE